MENLPSPSKLHILGGCTLESLDSFWFVPLVLRTFSEQSCESVSCPYLFRVFFVTVTGTLSPFVIS